MDTSRAELLNLLTSLGVEYPPGTKLPDATLEERLIRALDGAQDLRTALPKLPFDPASLSLWKTSPSRPLSEAVQRNTLGEARNGVQPSMSLYEQPFLDLRQSLLHLAKYCDEGFKLVFMMDAEGTSAVCMRHIEVRKINDDTPVFLVAYHQKPSVTAVQRWAQSYSPPGAATRIPQIQATLAEQRLLLRLLSHNNERIISSYKPKRSVWEKDFKISFLLPVGPLRAEDIGTLNRDPGCAVCGEKTRSRCSRCAVVSYCSPVCQTEDWKSHKTVCKSFATATWKTVKISHPPGNFSAIVSNHSRPQDIAAQSANLSPEPMDKSIPPASKHGTNPFIVKLQSRRGPPPGLGMSLIYDRQRTFQMYSMERVDKEGFEALLPLIAKGWRGIKVFCWARRISDWELSICLDRLPDQDIKW